MTTCPWGGFERADDVGCEADLCGWIVHPAEAWSNVAFLVVAVFLVVRHGRADRGLPVAWLPAIVAAIGLGSFAFHASMIHWLHVADVAAIFVLTAFLLAAYLRDARVIRADRFAAAFVAIVAGGVMLAVVDPRLGWLGILGQALGVVWLARRLPVRGSRRDLIAAIALNQAAAAMLWLDKAQVGCVRGPLAHVVQPHSFWHVLSALSLLFVYRYQRRVEHVLRG